MRTIEKLMCLRVLEAGVEFHFRNRRARRYEQLRRTIPKDAEWR